MKTAVVYPTFRKEVEPPDAVLHRWSRVGDLHIIVQGEPIGQEELPSGTQMLYTSEGKGAWGSQYWALFHEGWQERLRPYDRVIVCMQKIWDPAVGIQLLDLLDGEVTYAHAWRTNIAAHLSVNLSVGTARALLECWLTAAYLRVTDKTPGTIKDGFSGLLVMAGEEYTNPVRWKWTQGGTLNWGGAFVNQAFTLEQGCQLAGGLFDSGERIAPSATFSEEAQIAVNQIIEKVKSNPIFVDTITHETLRETRDNLPRWFPEQAWLQELGADGASCLLHQYLAAAPTEGTFFAGL